VVLGLGPILSIFILDEKFWDHFLSKNFVQICILTLKSKFYPKLLDKSYVFHHKKATTLCPRCDLTTIAPDSIVSGGDDTIKPSRRARAMERKSFKTLYKFLVHPEFLQLIKATQ
jgi:hypothetical protein